MGDRVPDSLTPKKGWMGSVRECPERSNELLVNDESSGEHGIPLAAMR